MKNKISWKPFQSSKDLDDNMVLQTKLGVFKVNDHDSPFNNFDFEVMNTNFRVMESMIPLLNSTEGLEVLVCLSSYRIVCGFAHLFSKDRVKQLIELRLVGRILNTEVSIENIPENLRTKLKDTGTLVFPNGHIEYLEKDHEDEDKEVMKKCADLVGGIYYENI